MRLAFSGISFSSRLSNCIIYALFRAITDFLVALYCIETFLFAFISLVINPYFAFLSFQID